jgi:hypothetical protein
VKLELRAMTKSHLIRGGDDLLDHAVDEVVLFRVAAQIGEGEHRNRRLVGERWDSGRHQPRRSHGTEDAHRPCDVLERLLADVLEGNLKAACGILLNAPRDADTARLGQAFEPRGHVYPVAQDVAVLDDDVPLVDADAELDAVVRPGARVPLGHRLLNLNRAAQRTDHAAELDEQAVAGSLDETAVVLVDLRIDQVAAQRLEAFERALLVGLDQPRIPRHISGEDRRETAFDASWPCGLHGASPVANDPTRTSARRTLSMDHTGSGRHSRAKINPYSSSGAAGLRASVSANRSRTLPCLPPDRPIRPPDGRHRNPCFFGQEEIIKYLIYFTLSSVILANLKADSKIHPVSRRLQGSAICGSSLQAQTTPASRRPAISSGE